MTRPTLAGMAMLVMMALALAVVVAVVAAAVLAIMGEPLAWPGVGA